MLLLGDLLSRHVAGQKMTRETCGNYHIVYKVYEAERRVARTGSTMQHTTRGSIGWRVAHGVGAGEKVMELERGVRMLMSEILCEERNLRLKDQ